MHKAKQGAYIYELDTLRAMAVTLVIMSHTPGMLWAKYIPYGGIGVGFFFVLSGFLITGILLKERDSPNLTTVKALKVFYIRRTLRIFPAYYLFLFINYIIWTKEMREYAVYFILYISNILFFKTASYAGAVSPTWSLAVEEQFYLTWPLILLIANKKYTGKIILGGIVFSPIFRIVVAFVCKKVGQNSSLEGALMPSNMIYLMTGAYLSYLTYIKSDVLKKIASPIIPIVLLLLYVLTYIISPSGFVINLMLQITLSGISLWIINKILLIRNKGNQIAWLLNPITRYLGRISYGMYLYHTIAVLLVGYILPIHLLNLETSITLHFLASYICVVIVATLSWYLFERPINNLKKHFAY